MLDVELIKSLNVNEIIAINELYDIAKQAKKFSKLIKETYVFNKDEDKIKLLDDGKNSEYLTREGYWITSYVSCGIPCDEETLYECFKADYLVSHHFCNKYDVWFLNEKLLTALHDFMHRTQQLSDIKKVN